jgi:hypothetical protein
MTASSKWPSLITLVVVGMLLFTGCRGFRRPMGGTPTPSAGGSANEAGGAYGTGWGLIPLKVEAAGDDLVVDLAIRNDTGAWSVMRAGDKPATLTTSDGKTFECDASKVGTGGHYLPFGFLMKGYTLRDGKNQLLQVVCKGADPAAAARLAVPYSYVTGEYDYYAQDKGRLEPVAEVDLTKIPTPPTYPTASAEASGAEDLTAPIAALNDTTVTNVGATRTTDGITFKWKIVNPGEYDTKVHLGEPPVLGADGIVYGTRVSPDIVDQPAATAKGGAEFETRVAVPRGVAGLYLLLSVEGPRERLFGNHLIDLTALK